MFSFNRLDFRPLHWLAPDRIKVQSKRTPNRTPDFCQSCSISPTNDPENGTAATARLEPATSRGLIQFCVAHPQQFRNVFFGPENRNGVRAGEYINDLGAPLFGRFVQLFFDVAKDEGLPNRDDIVVAHTWWFNIFGLATLMVIQGVVPELPDQALVVEQTIATLWAGVQAVPRLPKSAISKRSGRSTASKQ